MRILGRISVATLRRRISLGYKPGFSAIREWKFRRLLGSVLDITERKRAEELLIEANTNLEKQLKDRTRAEREIQALNACLINAQEEERARIARELHDDLSQGIASLSLGISNLKRAVPPEYSSAHAQSERLQQRTIQLRKRAAAFTSVASCGT